MPTLNVCAEVLPVPEAAAAPKRYRMPAISGDAYATITLAAVERALTLTAVACGGGVYVVSGGYEDHWINLYDPDTPRCDCYDHTRRVRLEDGRLTDGTMCKHLVRVLMDRKDPRLLAHLKLMREKLNEQTQADA